METLILCGGKGTRAYPHTSQIPKPLMVVGDKPILLHLMEIYARQGFTEFLLAGGYLIESLQEFAQCLPSEWKVTVVDTGEETGTGGRVRACADRLGSQFFVTYGDGLGNVNLRELLDQHNTHAGSATVTAVPLRSPFGIIEWNAAGRVSHFREKPLLSDYWINAGFFVFDAAVFDSWEGDDLEGDVLPELSRLGRLYVHQHAGFWRSMDTYKDALELSGMCTEGGAPWEACPAGRS